MDEQDKDLDHPAYLSDVQNISRVTWARTRASAKRGGRVQRVAHSSTVNLDEIADVSSQRGDELIAVDDALMLFEQVDPRKARVVELRFFGGLSVDETARFSRCPLKLSCAIGSSRRLG
jgi:DNA-directed RNA polymerase specialized sigma24 family protein